MSDRLLDRELIASHNSSDSCWVIVNDIVYDVTDFLDHHPGGSNSILRYAGKVRYTIYYRLSSQEKEKETQANNNKYWVGWCFIRY